LQSQISVGVFRDISVKAVPTTVNFDDESPSTTLEVHNVGRNGRLTAEMKSKLTQLAKSCPKLHFLRRHSLAK